MTWNILIRTWWFSNLRHIPGTAFPSPDCTPGTSRATSRWLPTRTSGRISTSTWERWPKNLLRNFPSGATRPRGRSPPPAQTSPTGLDLTVNRKYQRRWSLDALTLMSSQIFSLSAFWRSCLVCKQVPLICWKYINWIQLKTLHKIIFALVCHDESLEILACAVLACLGFPCNTWRHVTVTTNTINIQKLHLAGAVLEGSAGIWTRDLSHPKRESYP